MRVEDFQEKIANGVRYIEFVEDPTKTRNGGLRGKQRATNPKMFGTGGSRCPVKLFELYLEKRPDELKNKGRFYLKPVCDGSHPFRNEPQPVRKNTISNFMKDMIAGTSVMDSGKKLSNHSGRKTCVKKLRTASIPDSSIIKVTGHTTTKGLDSYDREDEREFQRMSNALHQDRPSTSQTSSVSPMCNFPQPQQNTVLHRYQENMVMQQNRIVNYLNHPSFMPNFSFFPSDATNHQQQQQPPQQIFYKCTFNNGPAKKKRRLQILSDSEDDE